MKLLKRLSVSRRPALWLALVAVLGLLLAAVCVLLAHSRRPRVNRRDMFDPIIWEASRRHQVSPFMVKAVIWRESSFYPWALGGKDEIGLMQITAGAVADWERGTGKKCRLRGLLFDPRLNIEIGTWYLGRALARWREHRDSDVLALAQYNAGATNAARWSPKDPREEVSLRSISFPPTREYIRTVLQYRLSLEKEYTASERN